jgi:predicted dehydrogenase
MKNKGVRTVAVIGAGSIGYRHLKNLDFLGVEKLLVYEPESTRRSQIQTDHPYWSFHSQLTDLATATPDAVIVASPSALHEEHARAALAWGAAIFVEKPLAPKWGSIRELSQEAVNKNRVTMVACNMRFHPGPALVKTLLAQGVIGDLISYRLHFGSCLPNWRPYQDYRQSYSASAQTGGAILDCIHELDLALWYAGPAELVAARHRPAIPIGLETDGLAEILLEHQTGVLGSIHLNFIEREYRRYCVCIGSSGTLEWNFHRPEVIQYGPGPTEQIRHPLPDPWELNQMYIDEMRHFLDCVAEGRPTDNSIAQNLPCLKLALEARASVQ